LICAKKNHDRVETRKRAKKYRSQRDASSRSDRDKN
jgi:hypothetical protein